MPENNSTPPAPETPAVTPTPAASTPATGEPVRLPDDHPLVKALAAKKSELEEARTKLAEIDDAQKTDAQKLADKIAKLETENAKLASDALRNEVAAAKGVPARLISGSTKEELEAAADELLAFKGTPSSPLGGNQKPAGPVSQVGEHEETREDRRKRLEGLKR